MAESADVSCKRCKENAAVVKSRKEPFCGDCFVKFVSLKQRKRMMGDDYYRDIFKVSYQKDGSHNIDSIAFALDFQSSSLVCFDIITQVLKEQLRQHRGKYGFTVDAISVFKNEEEREFFQQNWNNLLKTERYLENDLSKYFKLHLVDVNNFIKGVDLEQIVLHNVDFTSMADKFVLESGNMEDFTADKLLAAFSDRNTKEDFMHFMVTHIVKKLAYQLKSKVIIWAHSMTKLADLILSLVIKGRGSQIAENLDDESFDKNFGNNIFKNLYPMKDILLSEIDAYCIITNLDKFIINYKINPHSMINKEKYSEFDDMRNNNNLIIKNMTINEIVRKYYDDMEDDYSNIVATVLRTGDKLQSPEQNLPIPANCSICSATIYDNSSEWLKAITIIEGHPIKNEEEEKYFNLWKDSKIGIETQKYMDLKEKIGSHGETASLCYGCIINLNNSKMKNIIWPKKDENELEKILNEFELSDTE